MNAITCPAATAGHPFDRISIYNGKHRTMNIFPRRRYQGPKGEITGGRSFACR